MSKCSYCHKEMPLPSRHEPNCSLNPKLQEETLRRKQSGL